MPWELPELLSPQVAKEGWEKLNLRDSLARTIPKGPPAHALVSALELSWYMNGQLLRDADWAGMAQSLEIRVPFVDVDLFRRLAPALVSVSPPGKNHLAQVCGPALPEIIRARPKTGFSVPMREWLGAGGGDVPARGLRGWARFIAAHAAG